MAGLEIDNIRVNRRINRFKKRIGVRVKLYLIERLKFLGKSDNDITQEDYDASVAKASVSLNPPVSKAPSVDPEFLKDSEGCVLSAAEVLDAIQSDIH